MNNLQSITVNLKLSIELAVNGYPQENSLFYWIPKYLGNITGSGDDKVDYVLQSDDDGIAMWGGKKQRKYAAPTAQELLNHIKKHTDIIWYDEEQEECVVETGIFEAHLLKSIEHPRGSSLAEALAKLYVKLKQQEVI